MLATVVAVCLNLASCPLVLLVVLLVFRKVEVSGMLTVIVVFVIVLNTLSLFRSRGNRRVRVIDVVAFLLTRAVRLLTRKVVPRIRLCTVLSELFMVLRVVLNVMVVACVCLHRVRSCCTTRVRLLVLIELRCSDWPSLLRVVMNRCLVC